MNSDFNYKVWTLSKTTMDSYSSGFTGPQHSPPWCQMWVGEPRAPAG